MHHIKDSLENNQIYIYFISIIIAIILGLSSVEIGQLLESWIMLLLAILMFAMFTQIPFTELRQALNQTKFVGVLLLTNFVMIPILVFFLIQLFQIETKPLELGIYLVLLTPCIDYVIVFTHLGKGDASLITIATPILLIVQMLLLPIYLTLLLDYPLQDLIIFEPFVISFVVIIVVPLCLAILLQYFSKQQPLMLRAKELTSWLPVPMMSLVLFAVISSQITKVLASAEIVFTVIPIYVCFLLCAPLLALFTAKLFGLSIIEQRTLTFSTSTRNSLVVLPLALALPSEIALITSTVIITQTIIELMGELVYIRVFPKVIN
ncbi:arsenic resistance protein [Staphylococcus arlettae]|uniref:arsenic resistance protein n=1 Tax=Staphylococcus arlettae TaxID=29378 RepID=UPI002DBC6C57|nr:arsenic resistance protein [Staphylococcus arlettae]MEB7421998.1 arsenic resistance protein [Staphylococcus arlettae]